MTYLLGGDLPTMPAGARLRELLARGKLLPLPGAHNGMAPRQPGDPGSVLIPR